MNRTMFNVIGIGELVWDTYPNNRFIGGSAANFSIHSNQLGDRGIIVSRVGNDTPGSELLRELNDRGLTTDYIQIDFQKPTGSVHVKIDETGIPRYCCSEDAAFDTLELNDKLKQIASEANAVYFNLIAQRHSFAQLSIRSFLDFSPQALKLFDLNLRKWTQEIDSVIVESLKYSNIVRMNIAELRTLQHSWNVDESDIVNFSRFLIDTYSLELVIVTMGENGCYLVTKNEHVQSQGRKRHVIDTNGAGDAFASAVVHKYLRQASLAEIAEFGNQIAGYVTQQFGATPRYSLPDVI